MAMATWRRYGCNQRDDNQYYRVNPTHLADLGGVIPRGSICDGSKRLLWHAILRTVCSALFISGNADRYASKIEISPWCPWIFTRLWFLSWTLPTINRGNDVAWLILPSLTADETRRARATPVDHRIRPLSIATSLNMFNSRQSLPIDYAA